MKRISQVTELSVTEREELEIHEIELAIDGVTRPLTVHLYSDIHLAYTDGRDGPMRREQVIQRRIYFPTAPDVLEMASRFNKNNPPDATVFLGDIIDFSSELNLEVMEKRLPEEFSPYLYVLGNHDTDTESGDVEYSRRRISAFQVCGLLDITPDCLRRQGGHFKAVDLGEIIMACADIYSEQGVEDMHRGLDILRKDGRPVIFCIHGPMHTQELLPRANAVWGGHVKLPLFDELNDESYNIAAVFAGHVHFFDLSYIGGRIPQIVVTSTENKYTKNPAPVPHFYAGGAVVKIIPIK